MFKLYRYLKDYKVQVILGPLFKIIEAIFELIVPIVMGNIIDNGIIEGSRDYVLKMGGVLVVLAVVGLCSTLCCQLFASYASTGYGTLLRNKVFNHINNLSNKELEKFGSGSLINRVNADVNQMQLSVAMLIRLVIRAPFLVVGATIMAFSINKMITIIFVITAVIVSLILYIIMKYTVPHYKLIQGHLDEVTTVTKENLTGARVVRAFTNESLEQKRYRNVLEKYIGSSINVGKISSLLNPLTYGVVNVAIVLILYYGGNYIYNGDMSTGEITALVNYLNQILVALIVVANLVLIFTKASSSAYRINEILDTIPSIDANNRINPSIDSSLPIVSFENVSFAYGNDKEVLKNITFSVIKNESVGIIGTTGSGKSTLVNLIPCLYNINSGNIFINGVSIYDYDLKSLRKRIGFVPQKAVLLSGTIKSNLQMKDKNVSDEEIIKALRISQSYEFVNKFDDFINHSVDQGGRNFSGGQRQRLTIARSLIGNPDIIILDDSSSALDFKTDLMLRKAIKECLSSSTLFIVSQRVSAIKDCDKIIVMKDGSISGIGTHDYLLNTCLEYQKINESQIEGGNNE